MALLLLAIQQSFDHKRVNLHVFSLIYETIRIASIVAHCDKC